VRSGSNMWRNNTWEIKVGVKFVGDSSHRELGILGQVNSFLTQLNSPTNDHRYERHIIESTCDGYQSSCKRNDDRERAKRVAVEGLL
jgi:hypothetical protein